MIELKNISKIYKNKDNKVLALKDINLKFESKGLVCILGESGSGKTTLLNLIGTLDKYDSGDMFINGNSFKKLKDKELDYYKNNYIGFVFQNYNLINHISILKNTMLPLILSNNKNARIKALNILDYVGLKTFINKKPNELSGGQMQRASIARALVNDPKIILADEPTGALDSINSDLIMKLLKKLSKEKLVIVVTHNEILAKKYSDRIIKLKDGQIISDTNKKDLFINNKKISFKKTKMKLLSSINLSFNNLIKKKMRFLLTSFASSIGLSGILLILSLSYGFNSRLKEYEKSFSSIMPIIISSKEENKKKYKDYPNSNKVYVYKENNVYKNYDLSSVVNKIDNSLIKDISYYRINNFNLISKNNDKYNSFILNSNYLTEVKSEKILKQNYDLLLGKYPKNKNELAVVVNKNNLLDEKLVNFLLIDDEFNESKMINKELKLISNDNLFSLVNENIYVKKDGDNNLYNNLNNKKLVVKAIVRLKEEKEELNTDGKSNTSSILYYSNLLDDVINMNEKTNIILKLKNNESVNIFDNDNIYDYDNNTLLTMFGENKNPYMIKIYPKDYSSKKKIINEIKKNNNISYTDYSKELLSNVNKIINTISIILICFSSISLIVSSIMIGIMSYVSVLERTKEIGILRALGARKKDISRIFNSENMLIGFIAAASSIIITKVLLLVINIILNDVTGIKKVGILNIKCCFYIILISILISVIGGFIPSKIASKKNPVDALNI